MRFAAFCVAVGAAIVVMRPIDAPAYLALIGYAGILLGVIFGMIAALKSGVFDDNPGLQPRPHPTSYRRGTHK